MSARFHLDPVSWFKGVDEQVLLPQGLTEANFARTPFLVFNRKDDSQVQWVAQAFGPAAMLPLMAALSAASSGADMGLPGLRLQGEALTIATYNVENYVATLRLTPVTDGARTFAEWSAEFDCDERREQELSDLVGGQVFQGGFDALKKHFRGTR